MSSSNIDTATISGIEQNTQNFLQALAAQGGPPIYTLSPEDARNVLRDAQAGVTATRYLGTIHDFVMLNAIADTPATRTVIAQATTMLRDILPSNLKVT
ncbi:hypothetical protein [Nostoc sp.]|uniref:hypothetical protein n=1 Tax=Nostoc sp. TaxID=1180 RepID=UPI002FF4FE43